MVIRVAKHNDWSDTRKKPLRSRYTSLSFCHARTMSGFITPLPSRAIRSRFSWHAQTFAPAPTTIRVPIPGADAQRPYGLTRPHSRLRRAKPPLRPYRHPTHRGTSISVGQTQWRLLSPITAMSSASPVPREPVGPAALCRSHCARAWTVARHSLAALWMG